MQSWGEPNIAGQIIAELCKVGQCCAELCRAMQAGQSLTVLGRALSWDVRTAEKSWTVLGRAMQSWAGPDSAGQIIAELGIAGQCWAELCIAGQSRTVLCCTHLRSGTHLRLQFAAFGNLLTAQCLWRRRVVCVRFLVPAVWQSRLEQLQDNTLQLCH